MERAAESIGAMVGWADIGDQALYVAGEGEEPPVILLPRRVHSLRAHWLLAHELGHLVRHVGPRGVYLYDKDEAAADRWAAGALIPIERVQHHGNASLDAFIGALAAHYGNIPGWDCPERRLAARIARIRLNTLEAA